MSQQSTQCLNENLEPYICWVRPYDSAFSRAVIFAQVGWRHETQRVLSGLTQHKNGFSFSHCLHGNSGYGTAMATYTSIIRQFSKARICVIGDMTADVFIYGKPHRLSREAPVIVVRYDSEELVPGGAANTVNNLLDLGAQVYPVGLLGRDYFGETSFFPYCR